jgi:hypothetical protein
MGGQCQQELQVQHSKSNGGRIDSVLQTEEGEHTKDGWSFFGNGCCSKITERNNNDVSALIS